MTLTKTKQPRRARVTTFTEFFTTPGADTNGTCYADFSKETAVLAEKCICVNPYKCRCKAYTPPSPKSAQSMAVSLFKHSRPFLMYTIQRECYPHTRFSFFCKIEQEAIEEIQRLSSILKNDTIQWTYDEESSYNEAALADYRDYQAQMSAINRKF